MNNHEAIATLNQLLGVLCRSLPVYLSDARPWSRLGSWKTQTTLDRLTADLRMYAGRLTEEIDALGGRPETFVFPAEFTGKNDLAIRFLVGEIVGHLKQDAAAVGRIAARLETVPALHALAEEILGNVKGHADVLEGMMNVE